jgi:hypothetical protein
MRAGRSTAVKGAAFYAAAQRTLDGEHRSAIRQRITGGAAGTSELDSWRESPELALQPSQEQNRFVQLAPLAMVLNQNHGTIVEANVLITSDGRSQ